MERNFSDPWSVFCQFYINQSDFFQQSAIHTTEFHEIKKIRKESPLTADILTYEIMTCILVL